MTNLNVSLYGPDVQLEYQCGDKSSIRFESQQNYCFAEAGAVNARILSQINLNATYQAHEGAYLGDVPGRVNWFIKNS